MGLSASVGPTANNLASPWAREVTTIESSKNRQRTQRPGVVFIAVTKQSDFRMKQWELTMPEPEDHFAAFEGLNIASGDFITSSSGSRNASPTERADQEILSGGAP